MKPIQSHELAMDLIHQVKAGAEGYCTNLFPAQRKLQNWIEHGELAAQEQADCVLFLRRDRDFWHLYFCAASMAALEQGLSAWPQRQEEPVVVDLVGDTGSLDAQLSFWGGHGFRQYNRLFRMSRPGPHSSPPALPQPQRVSAAQRADCPAILDLLWSSFDPRAEQLPSAYEIEAAVENQQILVTRNDGGLGGLLFFETQGLTSAVRYWLVAKSSRSLGFGSALMTHYFAIHSQVRRTLLWVIASNEAAIAKYRHYGFTADGLVDYVLANDRIIP